MILDLATAAPETSETTEVLIVGASIAGLLLASELCRRGIRVIVLESGACAQREATHPLNEVVQLGDNYRGATHGRFRCLGGTSTRWGGALIPFLKEDFQPRPHVGLEAWPVQVLGWNFHAMGWRADPVSGGGFSA